MNFLWMARAMGILEWCAALSGCASLWHSGDLWWGEDKAKHFAVCGKIYWEGSHVDKLRERFKGVL